MIGGTNKGLSIALGIAAAGLAYGGVGAAHAADFGGGAYADLEERIAELEATAARKGNRKVSLTITGNVNQTLFFWDDGVEDNVYVQTNEINPTKLRFHGDAKINDEWKAGYVLELGIAATRQDKIDQFETVGLSGTGVFVRHSTWYLDSKRLGRVWVGHTSDAADGTLEVNLANTGHFASSNVSQSFGDGNSGFFLRLGNGAFTDGTSDNNPSNVRLGDLVVPGWGGTPDSHRYDLVKYETPTIAGFKASASWGADDIWGVALRYAGEAGGFKFAAAVGYTEYSDAASGGVRRGVVVPPALGAPDIDVQEWGASASLLHEPTGLFISGAYGRTDDNNASRLNDSQGNPLDGGTDFYFIQAGLERKFIPLGATTFYGEYFSLERGAAVRPGRTSTTVLEIGGESIIASEIQGWGVGVNQNLNGAIDVYLAYRHLDIDVTLADGASPALKNFDYVTAGANIKF